MLSTLLISSVSSSEGQCALHLRGDSYVGLSAAARVLDDNIDRSQYTYQLWFTPSQYVAKEQGLLQTGILRDDNGLYAVEIKFRTTVWARTESKPAVTAVSVDVWAQNSGSEWTKTRFSTVLSADVFPWVHITFNAASNTILVNGERKRTDKATPKTSDESPRSTFALGEDLHGMLEDVRIWSGPSDDSNLHATLCSVSTTDIALYIPFNECEGDTIVAYAHSKPVCTMLYGGNNQWTKSYPVESAMCPAQLSSDVCSGASRIVPPSQHAQEPMDALIRPLTGVLAGVVACGVVVVVVMSALRRRRNSPKYSGVPQMV